MATTAANTKDFSLAHYTDEGLAAEKQRLSQKAADLSRDLAAIEARLEELRGEDHRRFCEAVRRQLTQS